MKKEKILFWGIVIMGLVSVLFTHPFLRYPFDIFSHLIWIDPYYDTNTIPEGRRLWHFLWAKVFYLFSIPNSEVFFRAQIIHVTQTYIAFFSLFYFSKVALRNSFKKVDKLTLSYLSLWAVIIWFSIFATYSEGHMLVWNLWYSVNYQITLPLFWYITALTLVLFLEETSLSKKIFFILQILLISRFILQVHSMEFLYYLMYLLVFSLVYLDLVYRFLKKYYLLLFPMAFALYYFAVNYQPENSKLMNYLTEEKFFSLYDDIMKQGEFLVNSGLNRAVASINELVVFFTYLCAVLLLFIVVRKVLHRESPIHFRTLLFVLLTAMFVYIPTYYFTGGLFAILTKPLSIQRIYYSSSIFLILPIFLYYLFSLLPIHKNRLLLLNLSFIFILSSVWAYSKYETKYQVYYHNVKSIKNSFFERRVGFNLSPEQIATIGKQVEEDEKNNKSGKQIYYFARADVAFVLKYVYRKDVFWKGRRGYPKYEDFIKHIKKSKVVDEARYKNSDTLVDYMKKHKNETIILSVRDEGQSKLSKKTRKYLEKLGIDFGRLKWRGSFAAVIVKEKLIDYKIDNHQKVKLSSKKLKKLGIDEVISAGKPLGNVSKIIIHGKEYSKNRGGINIVTIDEKGDISSTFVTAWRYDAVGENIQLAPLEKAKKIIVFKIPEDFPSYRPYQ